MLVGIYASYTKVITICVLVIPANKCIDHKVINVTPIVSVKSQICTPHLMIHQRFSRNLCNVDTEH